MTSLDKEEQRTLQSPGCRPGGWAQSFYLPNTPEPRYVAGRPQAERPAQAALGQAKSGEQAVQRTVAGAKSLKSGPGMPRAGSEQLTWDAPRRT